MAVRAVNLGTGKRCCVRRCTDAEVESQTPTPNGSGTGATISITFDRRRKLYSATLTATVAGTEVALNFTDVGTIATTFSGSAGAVLDSGTNYTIEVVTDDPLKSKTCRQTTSWRFTTPVS